MPSERAGMRYNGLIPQLFTYVSVIIVQVWAERTGRHHLRRRSSRHRELVSPNRDWCFSYLITCSKFPRRSEWNEQAATVWPPRRPRLESDVKDDNAEPEPPQRRKKARRRANLFIESEAGVDGDATEEESDKNYHLADFIVPDYVEY